tara:strand:- start:26569 stop:27276 length:708 start_codon:yes stop_codon:yes gene_type:complete
MTEITRIQGNYEQHNLWRLDATASNACVNICLVAMAELLGKRWGENQPIHQLTLDAWLQLGSRFHQASGYGVFQQRGIAGIAPNAESNISILETTLKGIDYGTGQLDQYNQSNINIKKKRFFGIETNDQEVINTNFRRGMIFGCNGHATLLSWAKQGNNKHFVYFNSRHENDRIKFGNAHAVIVPATLEGKKHLFENELFGRDSRFWNLWGQYYNDRNGRTASSSNMLAYATLEY